VKAERRKKEGDSLELEEAEPPPEPPLEPPFPPPLPFRFSNSTTVGIGAITGIDVDVEVLATGTSRIFSVSIVGTFTNRQYRIHLYGYIVPSSTGSFGRGIIVDITIVLIATNARVRCISIRIYRFWYFVSRFSFLVPNVLGDWYLDIVNYDEDKWMEEERVRQQESPYIPSIVRCKHPKHAP